MRRILVLSVLTVACEPVPPGSLDDVAFAHGVRLDTHHEVAFSVDAPGDATLRVRLDDGRSVYSGPASVPARRPVRVRVPGGTDGLWVDVAAPGLPDRQVWVAVHDAVAALDLGGVE